MKQYLIKLAALSVASVLGVGTLAACGTTPDKTTEEENPEVTESVTESNTESGENAAE